MTYRYTPLVLGALALSTTALAEAPSPGIDWDLDDAMYQVDQQTDNFKSAMAQVSYSWSGEETTSGTGVMFINERGDMRFSQPNGNVLLVDGDSSQAYDKAAGTVTEYRFRDHPERVEPYVRLGFSIFGDDLEDDYLMTIIGEENVGDARTLVFELTPKSDRVRQVVGKVKLNIDQASWMPVRQTIDSIARKSTITITYTGMARNLQLNPDLFDDKWPKGTEKVKPE